LPAAPSPLVVNAGKAAARHDIVQAKDKKQRISRTRGPFKSKILAAVVGLAILVAECTGQGLLSLARSLNRFDNNRDQHTTDAGIGGLIFGISALVIIILLWFFWEKIRARAKMLSQSLKAPSGDDTLERDGRPPILYLRSFEDDTSLYPDHEKELVE